MEGLSGQELRIGNWVSHTPSKNESTEANFMAYEMTENTVNGLSIDDVQPIPITEEWLFNFGFELGNYKQLNEKHFVNNMHTIKLIVSGVGFWDVYTDYNPCQIEFSKGLNIITDNKGLNHVHQLQNLYFALTGQELTLK